MTKSRYLSELASLATEFKLAPGTPFHMWAKTVTLVTLNMRYEKQIAFSRSLTEHPYLLTERLVQEAREQFSVLCQIGFIEAAKPANLQGKPDAQEVKHLQLFNEIWPRYEPRAWRRYVERYVHRIKVNQLPVEGRVCIDLGCGNGVFCFALLESGASFAAGIDFGPASIAFANSVTPPRGRAEFRHATVYETGYPDNTFDLAIQNGVFHHLDDEDRALREVVRILKPGGSFWYYTTGEGAISRDLWDHSVQMLAGVPVLFIEQVLQSMNVGRDKTAHLMDGLSATYAKTSWAALTARLATFGFGNFKRLTGGFSTDFDLDVIEADPYGREKFGEGDLRALCQLTEKPAA